MFNVVTMVISITTIKATVFIVILMMYFARIKTFVFYS